MGSATYDFDGETVVVTGGGSGIGQRMAMKFGDAGATVLVADINDRPRPDEPATHERIEERGGTAEFAETDVSNPDEIAAVVEAAREYGGVDVMVNNAGIIDRNGVLDATPDAYDRVGNVNARAVLFGCQHAGRDMIARDERGVILNTASISSEFSLHDHVIYDAAKGAVRMITRTAALDLAEHDIRVNAIAPGFTATGISEGGPDAIRRSVADDDLLKPVPFGRAGEPGEIAHPALFLASDAASYVTGELLFVDGGYHVV